MDKAIHAITMLYLQQQDLSSLSPEELYDKYRNAYERINTHHKSQKKSSVTFLE